MPQELHVVQCYSCQMYQVDIVKKTNRWKCKFCGEKQSLKTVFFQGSGKECRFQVQKLNGLKGDVVHSLRTENLISESHIESNDEVAKPATQSIWTDFVGEDEDAIYDEVCNGLSSEFVPETCYNQKSELDAFHRKSTEPSGNHSSKLNEMEIKRNAEEVTESSNELDVPAPKERKIEINSSTQSEWDQFLPDESSD